MSAGVFDASALDRPYEFLDECPDELLDVVLTLSQRLGRLPERVMGVRMWHDALMQGVLPGDVAWPPEPFNRHLRAWAENLSIACFCKGQKDLVDQFLSDLLRVMDRQSANFDEQVERLTSELLKRAPAELPKRRLNSKSRPDVDLASGLVSKVPQPELDLLALTSSLRAKALKTVTESMLQLDDPLLSEWHTRVVDWTALTEVFGDLGDLLHGRGQDFAKGVLKQVGWKEVLRLRALIQRLPQLAEIVRALGRLYLESEDEASISEQVFSPMRRADVEWRECPDPRVPAEVKGVTRSGDIARMLPTEAAMLGHPALKMLWHARRAERALLAYRVEGTELVREVLEGQSSVVSERPKPKPIRGPIVAIVDTSGSMSGLPEKVAKALVLEALRTAHAERRDCLLFAFGGHGEVLEHRLSLDQDGIAQLLSFLTCSFGGGTDTSGVLNKVLERLADPTWTKADVMLVTDGDWRVDSETIARVAAARDQGHRFHGVQVGFGGGLHSVCDPVHRFTDWRL